MRSKEAQARDNERRRKRREEDPEFRAKERERCATWYAANKERVLAGKKKQYRLNPEFRRQYAREQAARLREEFVVAYGGRCECCGEDEPRFLCLDHVNGGGAEDRASTGGRNTGIIRRLRQQGWPKDGYRLLCANCNSATSWGRICPHQERNG